MAFCSVEEAIERIRKLDEDGEHDLKESEMSILHKLVRRCGYDSEVPKVMAMDALLGGIETSACTTTYFLYNLAAHPDKQEKLYNEIITVVGKDGELNESSLTKSRYLRACLT